MTIEELSSVLQMQEEILQFSSFTNADAWELGNLIVAEAAKRGAAVLIRKYRAPHRKEQSADVHGSERAGRNPGRQTSG